ncbi:hypothetical protein O7599_21975 [Streptomyces sp. WMMC500]|uniref:hypothetical protein n=1 Tax=Streptomyces sp. WMMC500 TaxID=3015154 RepID=UPI00248B6D4F|nr:hypothetical protein [Streptomyces sp. WMMC500]WBB58304.1 hypothetical protein O7599_21975 [Streptomyces sp. WMMC500]
MSSEGLQTTRPAGTPGTPGSHPTRPSVSRPDALSPAALADARRHQPVRGLIGLAFVVPVAVLLSAAAGGALHSVVVLGPITTFALPIMAMIAFWWEDWPGTLFPRPWSGLSDTALVVAGGAVLAVLGQLVVNGSDLVGVFDPGPDHPGLDPAANSLAGSIFTLVLQLTLVCERRPLGRLAPAPAGLAAVGLCWVLGLIAWYAAVDSDAIEGESYGAWFTSIGAWQMFFWVALRGWPFARIDRTWLRLLLGNVVVVACGWAAYLLARHALDWPDPRITATAGTAIGCILLVSMLFEAWPAIRLTPAPGRTLAVLTAVALTALLVWLLPKLAHALDVPEAREWSWTTHVMLNATSTAVILHVVVWKRWPVHTPTSG